VIRRSRLPISLLLLCLAAACSAQETLLSVSFARDAWDQSAWVIAKNPTVEHYGKWVQEDHCIRNETPTDPAKQSALDETLTTMVYGTSFGGNFTARAKLEIGPGAAPGIILAQDWTPDAQGRPQYGEFYEAIVYEKGINLWHHFARDGKRTYEKWAYSSFALEPNHPYTLQVVRKGSTVEIGIDGRSIGVIVPTLTPELYLGIEGCEGTCRVYDFAVVK